MSPFDFNESHVILNNSVFFIRKFYTFILLFRFILLFCLFCFLFICLFFIGF